MRVSKTQYDKHLYQVHKFWFSMSYQHPLNMQISAKFMQYKKCVYLSIELSMINILTMFHEIWCIVLAKQVNYQNSLIMQVSA